LLFSNPLLFWGEKAKITKPNIKRPTRIVIVHSRGWERRVERSEDNRQSQKSTRYNP
jgi:hypothetical protein